MRTATVNPDTGDYISIAENQTEDKVLVYLRNENLRLAQIRWDLMNRFYALEERTRSTPDFIHRFFYKIQLMRYWLNNRIVEWRMRHRHGR